MKQTDKFVNTVFRRITQPYIFVQNKVRGMITECKVSHVIG